jgi:hypothetical protein
MASSAAYPTSDESNERRSLISSSSSHTSYSSTSMSAKSSSDNDSDLKVKDQTGKVIEDDPRSVEVGAVDGDYGSQGGHVFEDPKTAEYWRGVYETAQYEGRHRFDPHITWTAKEEKALRRKVSLFDLIEPRSSMLS